LFVSFVSWVGFLDFSNSVKTSDDKWCSSQP
jgi:hypothetical protein